jgi:hypothetical protein
MKATTKALRLEGVTQLQELVAEYADAAHPGLKVLDSRVLLGGSTVDLVALDRDHSLVLIVLGFAGDDEMLMRGLEAYSWCLEYPEALTRLYPIAALSAAEPPLLIYIGERLPDAFLRKVKHLRLPRVSCLEFRFGLQFVAVEGLRGTEDRPAGPARAPDPAPAEVATATAAAPRREAPARTVAEPDERRAESVRDYLQREFPTVVIYDFHEHERGARVFLLQDSQGSVVHQAAVADDLLIEHSDSELRAFFDRHKLARVLRQAGQAAVSVTRSGLKIERR